MIDVGALPNDECFKSKKAYGMHEDVKRVYALVRTFFPSPSFFPFFASSFRFWDLEFFRADDAYLWTIIEGIWGQESVTNGDNY